MRELSMLGPVLLAALFQVACLDTRTGSIGTGDTDTQADTPSVEPDTASPTDDIIADSHETIADTQSPPDTEPVLDASSDPGRDFVLDVYCPTAVIGVSPGLTVAPPTKLKLTGSQSFIDGDVIVGYRWEVDQPNGSQSTFSPSAFVADPTFDTNVAGVYTFRLWVYDTDDNSSCVPARKTVYVNPAAAIHIELTWDTPNDPDQTDTGNDAGADMDLHFLHPLAAGRYDVDGDGVMDGWFDSPFDTFWHNPSPNWGLLDPTVDDNPRLTMDDTGGAGPEIIELANPESDLVYKVGVHYWTARDLGNSCATLRVYLYGVLTFELSRLELAHRDMWTAALIRWSDPPWVELYKTCAGNAHTCSSDADCDGARCGPHIIPNYNHPHYPL